MRISLSFPSFKSFMLLLKVIQIIIVHMVSVCGASPWAQKGIGVIRIIELSLFLLRILVGCKWGCQKSDCLLSRPDLVGLDWAQSVFLKEQNNKYFPESLPSLHAIFWSQAIKFFKSFEVFETWPNCVWSPPVCFPIATHGFVIGIYYWIRLFSLHSFPRVSKSESTSWTCGQSLLGLCVPFFCALSTSA